MLRACPRRVSYEPNSSLTVGRGPVPRRACFNRHSPLQQCCGTGPQPTFCRGNVAGQARSGSGDPELQSLASDSSVIVGRGPVPRRAYFHRNFLYFGRCCGTGPQPTFCRGMLRDRPATYGNRSDSCCGTGPQPTFCRGVLRDRPATYGNVSDSC